MTSLYDLMIAVEMIVEVPIPNNPNRWIYGTEFKQLLDALRVFRNYYDERKASWGIPQSLITELDGYIAKFPTVYYHYTIKAKDQNNMVDALNVIGKLVPYGPPQINICYVKRVKVHWLNPDGSIKQTFDYSGNQRPKIPHWIDGVDYPDGNGKVETVWRTNFAQSVRSDTRTLLKWSKKYRDRITGSCTTPPINTDYSIFNFFRMPSEDISIECYMMDCGTGTNYNYIPVPVDVTDVSPPPPLTASIEGTIKGYFYNRLPTDQPLEGVTISVATLSQLTDAKGYYKITQIPVGYHTWKAEKTGWEPIKVSEEYRSGDVKNRDAVMVPK